MSSTTRRRKLPWEQNPDWWKGDNSKESRSFSTMSRQDVSHVYNPARNTFVDLLKPNDLEIPYLISEGKIKPYAIVTFSRVKPEVQNEDIKLSFRPRLEEVTVACSPIYDLAQYGKVHCIGVGRFSDNQFKPLIEDDMADRTVSREHGLIFLKKEGNENIVCYRDVGTKMDVQGHFDYAGKRSGSTNGTWVNDCTNIRNIVLEPWPQDEYLSLGEKIGNTHRFKLRYQLAPSDNDIKLSG